MFLKMFLKIQEDFGLYGDSDDLDRLRLDVKAYEDKCTKDSEGIDLLYYKFCKKNILVRVLGPFTYFKITKFFKDMISDDKKDNRFRDDED